MQKQTVAFSKNSSNLFFHILTSCNLSCRHCYINKRQHGSRTLDITTIKNWLTLFAQEPGKAGQTNLILLGGEPTLHPDLHLAVKEAGRMGFKSITIDTNGYLFNNILDKISGDDVDFLSFSLDGATRETNDAIRGKGCYDKVLKGIVQAVLKKFSCSMIYTVSEKNFHELGMIEELVKNLSIKRFFFQVIGLRGRSLKNDTGGLPGKFNPVSNARWLDRIPDVAENIARHGITVTYPKVFLKAEEPFECAGNLADNYFIFPNGRVYRCPLCEDYPLHAYQIVENTLIEMPKVNEQDLFELNIPEGCVMNKLVQPQNLVYDKEGNPEYKIACCMLKEEISG